MALLHTRIRVGVVMSNFIFTEGQTELIEALESGRYKQCKGRLYDPRTSGFCCLGVACVINGVPIASSYYRRISHTSGTLAATSKTKAVMNKLHLRNNLGCGFESRDSLAVLNDEGKSFKDIAQILRKEPEQYFSQGAES